MTYRQSVLSLFTHPGQWFRCAQVSEASGIDVRTMRAILCRMVKDGSLWHIRGGHKSRYYRTEAERDAGLPDFQRERLEADEVSKQKVREAGRRYEARKRAKAGKPPKVVKPKAEPKPKKTPIRQLVRLFFDANPMTPMKPEQVREAINTPSVHRVRFYMYEMARAGELFMLHRGKESNYFGSKEARDAYIPTWNAYFDKRKKESRKRIAAGRRERYVPKAKQKPVFVFPKAKPKDVIVKISKPALMPDEAIEYHPEFKHTVLPGAERWGGCPVRAKWAW